MRLIEELGALNKKFDSLVLSSNRRCKNNSLNGVKMKFMQHDKNRHFLMSSHKVTKGHNRKTCVHPGKGHNEVVDRSNVKNGNVKNEN